MRKLLLLLIAGTISLSVAAQNISGIVNHYYKVLKVDRDNGWVKLNATDGALPGFTRGLLIQMKGATMDATNTSAFGNITAINNAGNYELVNLCAFISDTVFFERKLNGYYTDGDVIQLVTIPVYATATITDTLKGQSWNSANGVGGVIAIEADTVVLNKPIDATGIGFRGGVLDTFPDCTFIIGSVTDYYMPLVNTGISTNQGAKKGEGIAADILNKEYGRGKQVSGGGGGNNHNGGGGGGSNYGSGGGGGSRTTGAGNCRSVGVGGIGGAGLNAEYDSSSTRIYLGGGGGSGHGNKNTNFGNTGKPGGHGGGIVIVTAKAIKTATTGYITANGARPFEMNTFALYANTADADSDGGGGGGAGGAIVLNCSTYSGNINLSAKGAQGSNVGIGLIFNVCDAPGGGGGGGIIKLPTASAPAGVTTDVSAGPSGLVSNSNAAACYNTGNGATDGTVGKVYFNYTAPTPRPRSPRCGVVLLSPIVNFNGTLSNDLVYLTATIADKDAVQNLIIERSFDGIHFNDIETIANNNSFNYQTHDLFQYRTVFYRILLTNKDGRRYLSTILKFSGKIPGNNTYVNIFPNPVYDNTVAYINTSKAQVVELTLLDATGKIVKSEQLGVVSGENSHQIQLSGLTGGVYFLRVTGSDFSITRQLMHTNR